MERLPGLGQHAFPGDIFFTRGGSWLSRAIRRVTRERGEKPTVANHCGIVVQSGRNFRLIEAAGSGVREGLWLDLYPKPEEWALFRPVTLQPVEKQFVIGTAWSMVGQKYGWTKIALHLADAALGGRYFFRRCSFIDDWPICSYLVSQCFAAAGKDFGVPSKAASPDDIWDFCESSEHYECIRPMGGADERRKASRQL